MEEKSVQSRRQFLKQLTLASAGAVLASALPGCTPPEPEKMIGSVAEFEEKGSLGGDFNGNSILAQLNSKGEIVIFSLTCSHKRCTVEWQEEEKEFHCPCHEGKYDRAGYVIDGPPPSPLRKYKHEIRGEELWVINEFV